MERAHGAEDEHEEHRAKNEGGHAHGLSDFAVRELERLPVAARAFKSVFDVVVHVNGVVDGDAQDHRHYKHRYHVERQARIAHDASNQEYWRDIWDHSDEARLDAPECKNHHDGDNHE